MSKLTQFYWAKLQGASNMFQKHENEADMERVQDICCQLVSESQCPPLCQIEAWKLRSQFYPQNYWFAKAQLGRALEVIAKCEEREDASEPAFAALKESKQTVKTMLKDRTSHYQQEWKAKGRDIPPSEDEWYEIVESESNSQEPIFEFIGKPFKGSGWPFESQAVEASAFNGKTWPPNVKIGPRQPLQQQQGKNQPAHDVIMEEIAEVTAETTQKV